MTLWRRIVAELRWTAGREAAVDLRFSFPSPRPDASRKPGRCSPENRLPKLLIIEDEPEMVVALRDNCEFEGFDVLVAADGAEGLDKALSQHPDGILLDVMLPKMISLAI